MIQIGDLVKTTWWSSSRGEYIAHRGCWLVLEIRESYFSAFTPVPKTFLCIQGSTKRWFCITNLEKL